MCACRGGNCSATLGLMPHMDRVVAAGTYWNNSVDGFQVGERGVRGGCERGERWVRGGCERGER